MQITEQNTMDYSHNFHSFLSSLVQRDSNLEIIPLLQNLIQDSDRSREISELKEELSRKVQEQSTLSNSLKEYVSELSSIIHDLESNITLDKYSQLHHEIVLEFARSLSSTTHPSNYSNEPPIPQDSKMRSSLLFNQTVEEEVKEVKEEEVSGMDWINANLETKETKVSDLSLLDLDL